MNWFFFCYLLLLVMRIGDNLTRWCASAFFHIHMHVLMCMCNVFVYNGYGNTASFHRSSTVKAYKFNGLVYCAVIFIMALNNRKRETFLYEIADICYSHSIAPIERKITD